MYLFLLLIFFVTQNKCLSLLDKEVLPMSLALFDRAELLI